MRPSLRGVFWRIEIAQAVSFRLNYFNVILRLCIECVSLGCDAVPVKLPSSPLLVPIQLMDLQNGTVQVVRVKLFELLNNFIYLIRAADSDPI